MLEFLQSLGGSAIIWLVGIVALGAYAIVAAIVQAWRRVRVSEIEASLKHQMLEKGLSAEEIERILKASSRGPTTGPGADKGTDETQSELVQNLAENGWSAEDIERIIRAMDRPHGGITSPKSPVQAAV